VTPRELAGKICRVLAEAGHEAYLVGGCVRDIVLGREPSDYDVSTDATPERVVALFPGSLTVGAKFGVVVVVEQGIQVEVATFRSDISYSDGRHPDRVVYSHSAADDVRRRDFTINGLLMDPRTGEVIDLVGGRADLDARLVRAIGDPELRFQEDKLRMLRAIRFAARFGFAIELTTFAAIRSLAPEISQVSAERIRDELTRLLTEGSARRGFELLDASGLLPAVLPEVARMKGVEQPPEFHPEGDVWIHTRIMLEGLPAGVPETLAWGVLLHDVGKPPTFTPASGPGTRIRFDSHTEVGAAMAEAICRRLRFSNASTEQIVSLVRNHLRFIDVPRMRPATLKRFVRLPRFEEHLELHRLDCLSSHGKLDAYEFVRRFLAETPPEEVRPPRLVSGDDLKALGLSPGPLFGKILAAVEEAQLEGRVKTREEALDLLRTMAREGDGRAVGDEVG
jgi:poly(A) polymerase